MIINHQKNIGLVFEAAVFEAVYIYIYIYTHLFLSGNLMHSLMERKHSSTLERNLQRSIIIPIFTQNKVFK